MGNMESIDTMPVWTGVSTPFRSITLGAIRSIGRVPLAFGERLGCYGVMGWWVGARWRELAKNLLLRG